MSGKTAAQPPRIWSRPAWCRRRARAALERGRGALCRRDHAGDGRPDRPGRSRRPDRAPVRARPGRTRRRRRRSAPTRSATTPISPVEGIVHRYPDRVLLKLAACLPGLLPVLLPPRDGRARRAGRRCRRGSARPRSTISAPVRQIWEVILTGGDPLVLSARRLRAVDGGARRDRSRARSCACIRACRSVDAGTDHRRAGRRAARSPGKATYVVLHANHPRELTPAARAACAPPHRRRHSDAEPDACCCAGVNDDADVLAELMRAFVECRIKPYYLHHGDLAPGTAICAPRSRRARR